MESLQSQDHNTLKNMNFLAWRVTRAQDEQSHCDIHRSLFERPRLRSNTQI